MHHLLHQESFQRKANLIKDKILGVLALIGGIFSAIFYVLFQQKKDENEKIKKAYEDTKKDAEEQKKINDAQSHASDTVIKEKEKNAEKKENAHNGNHLNNFNDGLDLLSK